MNINRNTNLLQDTRFDLVIVGGGIQGCGIARDAALRGLKVALLEKGDFAQATSSASSKLVHGGLRYLEHFRFGLVRESLHERQILLRTAPHLVRPLPFLVPLYDHSPHGKWKLRAGLTLYDMLARGGVTSKKERLPAHKWLSAPEVIKLEPRLNPTGLHGAFLYYDAQMNDARLVLENAIGARESGAMVYNQVEVEALLERSQRVVGVRARDLRSGQPLNIEAQLVVNAAGPWYGNVQQMQQLSAPRRVRWSRGSHLIVPSLTRSHALLLNAKSDGRVFFVMPWKGHSLLGTTEVEHTDSLDAVHATPAEIRYLLEETGHFVNNANLTAEDVVASFAGVRALHADSKETLGEVSRASQIHLESPGLLGVLGGKYTTYRAVSEKVVDRCLRILERSHMNEATTATQPLPGGDIPDMSAYFAMAEGILVKRYNVEPPSLRYLLGTYGTRHDRILKLIDEDPSRAEPLESGRPFLRAELVYAVREEMATCLDDILWRRTYRGHLGPLSDEARRAWEDAFRHAVDSVVTVA